MQPVDAGGDRRRQGVQVALHARQQVVLQRQQPADLPPAQVRLEVAAPDRADAQLPAVRATRPPGERQLLPVTSGIAAGGDVDRTARGSLLADLHVQEFAEVRDGLVTLVHQEVGVLRRRRFGPESGR